MDSDRIKGTAKEIKGGLKEVVGKVTNDPQTELEGKVEKTVGKIQRKLGEAKDEECDVLGDEE